LAAGWPSRLRSWQRASLKPARLKPLDGAATTIREDFRAPETHRTRTWPDFTNYKERRWEIIDLKSGKSADPPQIDPECNWSLSPDGTQRAVVAYGSNQGTIQRSSTSTGKTRDLIVEGWNGLMSAAWSANGHSLLATWHNHELDSALLHVTLDGRASVLLHLNHDIWGAVPSPDGRFLAIAEASGTKNVWQIESF
jgi:hypothetical protein